jgi:hypothetical protein
VPDRFRLEVGGFQLAADTRLQLNRGGEISDIVDFEDDLNLDDSSTKGFFEGFWRVGRRHLVSIGYSRVRRESDPFSLQRTINWGDETFEVGASVQGRDQSTYWSGAYRFAVIRNDKFEIGPALGLGHLSVEAEIQGEVRAGDTTRVVSESAEVSQPTGSLGVYLWWWPASRVLVRGDLRYILVKPGDSEASITDGRVSLLWHPWRVFGFGLQYVYTKFRYDRGILDGSLGGSLRYSGGQIVLSAAF